MKNPLFIFFLIFSSSLFAQQKETTQNPQKNRVNKYYYYDKVVSREYWYGDDKKIDSLKTYYQNGNKNEQFYYKDGKYQGNAYQYNREGEKIVTWRFEKGKLTERIDHIIDAHKNNEEIIIRAHIMLEKAESRLKENPRSISAFYSLTYARYLLGNTTLAFSGFRKLEKRAIKLAEDDKKLPVKMEAAIYDALGSIYSGYEMENQAIHYKYKAIKTGPNQSRLYYNFGAYLVSIKCYRLAQIYLNKAIGFFPNHAFSHWGLAKVFSDLEQYEKAMECINIAFKGQKNINKLNGGKSERDLNTIRGYLHHKLGDTEKGISDLNEALELNENNSYALRNLGEIYYDLEQYNKSCELLQKAKKLGYEKVHDKKNLDYFLTYSCENKTLIKPVRFTELPFAYPNPTKDIIKIQNIAIENFNYRLYNFNSQLISEGEANNKSIDISNFSTGLYILNLEVNGEMHSLKIIKE